MKIAIDALGIHYYGGGRSATLNLLESLFTIDTQNEYLVILSEYEPSLNTGAGNVHQWIAPFKQRIALRLWAQALFPFVLRSYDLVHFMKNLGVFFIPTKTVVTVYDLTTLIYPFLFPRTDVLYWKYIEPKTLHKADKIIAISQNTAKDIEHFYHVSPDKMQVIYPAYAPHFKPASLESIADVKERYALPDEFILHVGRIDRKKNLPLLLKAFYQVRKKRRIQHKLVFVGEEYSKSRDTTLNMLIADLGLRDAVIFTGPVPDKDVATLFSAATVAVFCSLHEGFGIVALESMACGTPLIVTAAGAVREVVGDAAIVLKSDDPVTLANAIEHVLLTADIQQELSQKGLARAQQFSWQRAAHQTLELYEEIVKC